MEPPPHLLASQPQHFSLKRCNHRSHRGKGDGPVEMMKEHSHSENSESSSAEERRGGGKMRHAALDCNLASLCDHIQSERFNNGVFSNVILNAMGSTYHLHRLILSQSSYFRFE
ncbi:BTB/POZ domain-containing protein [Perilla frutescens var. hirtella]|nr:BTB/POZ domain-containing protein [Perilla frutescens var. hirtella]KAH6817134.1 BTB/POZ domain-containing protein [Perilla frutescens var. frutescens]